MTQEENEVIPQDFVYFAVGVNDTSVVIAYGGPILSPENPQCALACELDGLSDSEVLETIEFDTEFPKKPGVYRWKGSFTFWESRDYETGYVDDWHLIGKGEFTTLTLGGDPPTQYFDNKVYIDETHTEEFIAP